MCRAVPPTSAEEQEGGAELNSRTVVVYTVLPEKVSQCPLPLLAYKGSKKQTHWNTMNEQLLEMRQRAAFAHDQDVKGLYTCDNKIPWSGKILKYHARTVSTRRAQIWLGV